MFLLVPLDDRPCCLQFVHRLADIAGVSLVSPPPELLGCFLEPGESKPLIHWFDENCDRVEKGIVSLDMIAFGGLVASRRPDPSMAHENLREWLEIVPGGAPIWAFQSVLRTAPTQTTLEEMRQAEIIVELSCLSAQGGDEGPLRARLPEGVLERYQATRERNHQLNRAALEWARQGILQGLLIGIDDSKAVGWNVLEVARLQAELPPNAFLTPGTDESAQLLLARLCHPGRAIAVRWSHPLLSAQVTRYEDRSLGELVQAQMAAAGLVEVTDSPWQLWIFGRPEQAQGEAEEQGSLGTPERFLAALETALALGGRIVVADVAHANGGDLGLGRGLAGCFGELLGYSAWNTAGNTLGTALAVLGCAGEAQSAPLKRFKWERWLDDLVYQSVVRPRLKGELGTVGLTLGDEQALRLGDSLARRLREASRELGLETPEGFAARLPWSRLFEVEVVV